MHVSKVVRRQRCTSANLGTSEESNTRQISVRCNVFHRLPSGKKSSRASDDEEEEEDLEDLSDLSDDDEMEEEDLGQYLK